jgi:type II secretory pathway component PulF
MNGEETPDPSFRPGEGPRPGPSEHIQGSTTEAKSTIAPRAAALSPEDLITLNEEIAGMARAGLPLDQGLAALAREMGRGRLQRVTAKLAEDLNAGHPLPEALEQQRGRVPPFYAALVAAGIRTGRVSEVLATLTIYTRALADLRSAVVGALFYPAIVLGLALTLFGLICFLLLPQYEQFFSDFKIPLPAVTRWTMTLTRHPLLYIGVPLLAGLVTLLAFRWALRRTEKGRRVWVRLVYAVPLVGTLIRSARLAAFTELLGILVDHALPLPEAFRLAGEAASDPSLGDGARRIEEDLRKGLPLAAVLRERGVVPELVAWMTAVGELRGTLAPTLHQVAQLYRRQVEMRAELLRSLLPPLFIIGTASLVVALFVFALILPFVKLLEGLSSVRGGR